ncbi:MAG: histone deacetylase [Dehalococcoidia bacterium]
MVAPVALVTAPGSEAHAAEGHPERPDRLTAILEHLERTGLAARMHALDARLAGDEEIARVHRLPLVRLEEQVAKAGGGWLDADTYVTPRSVQIARQAAGANLVAVEAVLGGEASSAFVAVRPPGHHATDQRAMGFCLLNNVAIAAAHALEAGLERVAIVDWDVHHGNGTQAIFDDDPRVLYFSTHAAPFYPGTGAVAESGRGEAAATKLNAPLPAGTGDAGFLAAYEQVCIPALERFRPDLVLVSSGWDAHARDPLAPLLVSTEGYHRVAGLVIEAARALCDGRVVVNLEGGYDTHALAWCASGLCEQLLGEAPTSDPDPVAPPEREPDIEAMLAALRREAGL